MTQPPKAPEPPAQTPLVAAVPTQPEAKAPTASKRRQPAWWTKPPVIVTAVMVTLVVELCLFAAAGPFWWAIVNAGAGAALVLFGLVSGRRGNGGLVDRLFARRPTGRPGAARTGTGPAAGRSGLGRLLSGGRSAGRSAGAPGSGRTPRTALGRAMTARRAARSAAAAGGSTGKSAGGRGRSLTNPFRYAGRSKAGVAGRSAAGRATGGGRGLLGLRSRAGRAAGGSRGGTGTSGRRSLNPFRRTPSGTSGRGTASGSTGGGAAKRSSTPAKWWRKTVVGPLPKGGPGAPSAPKVAEVKKTDTKPAGDKAAPAAPHRPTRSAKPEPVPARTSPRRAAAPAATRGGTDMSALAFSDDSSLQRWGRNLSGAEEAAREVEAAYRAAEEKAAEFRTLFGKVRTQGETEHVASNHLMADLDSVDQRAKQAYRADEWRAVATEAATLPNTFKREHETDLDRMDAPRKSRQHEKRADVTAAEQDN